MKSSVSFDGKGYFIELIIADKRSKRLILIKVFSLNLGQKEARLLALIFSDSFLKHLPEE